MWLNILNAIWVICAIWLLINIFKVNNTFSQFEKIMWAIASILFAPITAIIYYYKFKR